MAVGALLYAVLAIIAVASRGTPQGNDIILLITAAYSLAIIVLLMTLRGRTPLWLLQAQVLLVVGITGVLVALSPTTIGAANVSFRYLAIPIYVAFWMSWRMTVLTAALITVTSLFAYGTRDDASQLLLTWMLVSVLTWFLGIVVNYLSRAAARLATVDTLTGMLNRSALATLIELSQEPGRVVLPRTVVVIDIDDFKQINDTQGHLAGDRALTQLGDAWRRTLRADDIAVRSGGDEFLLILPKTSIAQAEALVVRLHADSTVPWSYGIADWPAHEDIDIAIAHADVELYKQKRARPNQPIARQEARRDGST